MSKETLHGLVDMIDENEVDFVYRLLLKFVPEAEPLPDELEALERGRNEIASGEFVRHEDINWD